MKRIILGIIVTTFAMVFPVFCAAQQSISEDSLQDSSQDSSEDSSQDSLQESSEDSLQNSTEESSQASTEESSQTTTDNSFQYSTEETTVASSEGSTQATTDGSAELGDASAITLIVGGAAVAVGLTAVGITYLVRVSGATRAGVVSFQDQIYAAEGPDYQCVLEELGIEEKDLVQANDEIVVDGFVIESDQDAADYLGALMLKLSGKINTGKPRTSSAPVPGVLPAA